MPQMNKSKHPISYISLNTRDLKRLTQFYEQIIGLSVLVKSERQTLLGTSDGKPLLLLCEVETVYEKAIKVTGLDHFAILFPERQSLANKFYQIIQSNYPISMIADHMVNESFYLYDPDGNHIELTRDFSADEIGSRIPLQSNQFAQTLYTEGKDNVSTKLQQNTHIGHILLRGTDLDDLEQFYSNVLGLNVSMRIPGAVFTSFGDYHHHIGFHVWEPRNKKKSPLEAEGLRYYTLHFDEENSFLVKKNLENNNIPYKENKSSLLFDDPSGNSLLLMSTITQQEILNQDRFIKELIK